MSDAAVVCRELGCGEAVDALSDAHFGPGSGPIWMNYVDCSGSESTLKNCRSSGWSEHTCDHSKDAGVICSGVRLVGGSRCSGRVEVLHGETWSTVCDADFDQQDAEVVCRELGCGLPVEVLGAAAFGRGEGQMWSEELQCRGNESQIHFCPTSSSLKHNCSHDSDVGLVCAALINKLYLNVDTNLLIISFSVSLCCTVSVRLVDGGSRCAGRVEVLHRGQWGTVCSFSWDMSDAAVVCRELGCGEAVDAPVLAHFGSGHGPIWMNYADCSGSESTLKNCKSQGWGKHNCYHFIDAGVICSGKKSRITDGFHLCSGRVEVLNVKTWSTVCDADFDQQDAEVVCRELGCGLPVEVLGAAAFGRGEGQVWSEKLQCRGSESEISFCPTSSSLKHNCTHGSDVGLVCSGHTGVRLVNSSDSCSGRVELQYLSEWGTVCDASWDIRAASVLCGQLNCGSAVAVLGSDWFGEGSGQIWADVFDCQGNETHLSKCPISSWSRTACSHKQDAGVICSGSSLAFHEGRVRLSGGMECEGEVEVYFRQDWRRVLLDSWSESEASVVCRQLGCGSVFSFSSSSPPSPEHRHMCMTGFNCSGSEAHLGNCSSAQAVNCSSRERLSITCSGKFNSAHSSIRLVGSGGDCAGRLEVFHSGSWGTVCDDLWDIKDAQVVCRQLQCGVALSAPVPAQFGPGTGRIWLNEVECEGNETSLLNCRFQQCGEDECGHMEDVGVLCSEFTEIRLTEGCEGNLEVFYNGTWGNVCSNEMSEETASVICRELNCGKSGRVSWGRTRVESAPNWLDHVKCRKHDSTLWHCLSSPWGQNNCDKNNEVAQLTCSGRQLRGVNGSCSGRLEVYHNAEWGSVCHNQWDTMDAQVVCRQLGCGPALSADGSAVFGAGEGPIWLNRVKCRGNEIHLWDCPHSLKNHTDCSHRQHARVTCTDISEPSTIAPKSTTTTSTTTVGQPDKGTTTPSPAVLFIYPVSLLVLGAVLFLALVLLVVLFYQNRVLRRVLSKRRRKTLTEAVYEEIDRRNITKRNDSIQRGRILSEEQHSGYEDVDEELLSGESAKEDTAEDYDDVITAGQISESVAEDAAENYDDVITADQSSAVLTEDMTDNYDDAVTTGPNSNIMTVDTPENYDDVITAGQDVGGVKGARLVNGCDSCSGRVELQYLSDWGTVCDGSGQIWADVFDCQGNETHLSKCPISSWSRTACSHEQDAGVICNGSSLAFHEGRVRLSGEMECEGEVEVYFRQDWRRVLLDSWSESEASVVCRQLGCGSVFSFSSSSTSSPEHRHMCVTGFSCSGSEAHLGNCSSAQAVNCSSREQLSITCSAIRLVGSGGDCAGRLEVFHSGSWGTVCDDLWDIEDAQVVCRQLQCGVALSAPVPAWFGPGTGPIWLNEVECEGNETSLWNCRFQQCGEDECGHKEDVGVVCSEFKEIRLTEGCEGNLEVFYNGTWGNVCVNGMDEETVSLICQELNCGKSGSEKPTEARVESAPNWLDNLKCRKYDSTLWHCPSSPWGQNTCNNHNEVAHITCSDRGSSPPAHPTCFLSPHQQQCSNHLPLRLSGTEGSCSGRLEVYHNTEWGSVCDDLWDIRDSQVVCRQLGQH
ncbi:scavenger receptor cysteine-rich type 1 protein M130-like [Colossoma macropomum]|uniref:scavenger receptor cysteine-rich type 1 protein M130-like n=1 Tax=Colossoma macropomum TaxID=42526 RepID=UPI0018640342|nr:scavenger receptor cysteine-rich type 1 protein M130-like [Colossoma macropomum]